MLFRSIPRLELITTDGELPISMSDAATDNEITEDDETNTDPAEDNVGVLLSTTTWELITTDDELLIPLLGITTDDEIASDDETSVDFTEDNEV